MARSSLNKAIFTGNLGKDPVISQGENGPIARAPLGVSDYQGKTSWANLVAFGKQAELMRDYLKKGSGVAVVARYQTREYEKDGQKQYANEFIVQEINFLGGRGEGEGQNGARRGAADAGEYDPEEALGFNAEPKAASIKNTKSTRRTARDTGDDLPF